MAKKNSAPALRPSSITKHMTGDTPTYKDFSDPVIQTVKLRTPESKTGVEEFYFQAYLCTRAADGVRLFVMESDLYGVNTILDDKHTIPAYKFRDGRVQCFLLRSVGDSYGYTMGMIKNHVDSVMLALEDKCDDIASTY